MSLDERTGKRVSWFSREHRPAENGGANTTDFARSMDAIDGDLDLVCNWPNCRATLAVIETTARPDQTVTYRREVARRLRVPFFHVLELPSLDGWDPVHRYQNLDEHRVPIGPPLTMDEWVVAFEVPLRYRHGCQPWNRPTPCPHNTDIDGTGVCADCGRQIL